MLNNDDDLAVAANPMTCAEELWRIAQQRPDLHRILLDNPSTYPELRQWLQAQAGSGRGEMGPTLSPSQVALPSTTRTVKGTWNAKYAGTFIAAAALITGGFLLGHWWSQSSLSKAQSTPTGQSIDPTVKDSVNQTNGEELEFSDPTTWKLSLEGFGPLRLGMTAAEGVATGGFKLIDYCDVGALEWSGGYDATGKSIVIANLNERGIVWQINIYGLPSPLDTGLGGGDSWETVVSKYGDRLIEHSGNSNDPEYNSLYAINGEDTHLILVKDNATETISDISGISLGMGTVTPQTIPTSFSCKAAWR